MTIVMKKTRFENAPLSQNESQQMYNEWLTLTHGCGQSLKADLNNKQSNNNLSTYVRKVLRYFTY